MTIDWDALEEFLMLDLDWSDVTVEKMTRRLRAIERAGVDLDMLTKSVGRRYLRERRKSGATPFAFNNDVKALNALYRFHTRRRKGPFQKRKVAPSTFKDLSPADVRRVLAYRHDDPDVEAFRRALVLWALKSGMRISEIHAMNVGDLNPRDSKFLVRKPAKLGARRVLPIEPWVWSPKRPFGAYLRRRLVASNDPEALWTVAGSSRGAAKVEPRRCPVSELRAALAAVGAATGVRLNFVITRHTRGTELADRWPLQMVQFYLGHAKIDTTSIYSHTRPGQVDRQMRRNPTRDPFQHGDL